MSDPADLIREADAALAQEAANEGGPIVDDPADLVRRLRDALEASEKRGVTRLDQASRLSGEVNRLNAALAEANATIAEREAERDEARKGVEQTMQLLFDTRARLDGLKAELAESNAAIERAKAMGAITGPLYTHALNQALKGERP